MSQTQILESFQGCPGGRGIENVMHASVQSKRHALVSCVTKAHKAKKKIMRFSLLASTECSRCTKQNLGFVLILKVDLKPST